MENEIKSFAEITRERILEGEKVLIADILDKEIIIKDFEKRLSMYKEDDQFFTVQAELDGKIITFNTASSVLCKQLNRIRSNLPVKATIKRPKGKRYFTLK